MIAENRYRAVLNTPLPSFTLEQSFRATPEAVRYALAALLDGLSSLGLSTIETDTVELVVAETLNNIVEHAFCDGTEIGLIWMTCAQQPGSLHLCFKDFGRAMPNLTLPQPRIFDPDLIPEDQPEGGFGWGLIRTLADDVWYVRSGLLNVLVLRIPIGNH